MKKLKSSLISRLYGGTYLKAKEVIIIELRRDKWF